jgi:hypothetical protein
MAEDLRAEAAERYIAAIDAAELAVRMAEAVADMQRPANCTADQALALMDPDVRDAWLRATSVAMGYWCECIEQMQRVQ